MSRKMILTLFINALIFIFIILPCAMALDDTPSLDCDGGIVAPGDSADSVKEKCGEPNSQSMDKWVYNFGPSEFFTVIFKEGKVVGILEGQ